MKKFAFPLIAVLGLSFSAPMQAGELWGYTLPIEPYDFEIASEARVRSYYAQFPYANGLLARALVSGATTMGRVPACDAPPYSYPYIIAKGIMIVTVHDYRGRQQFRSCSVSGTWPNGQLLLATQYPTKSIQRLGPPTLRIYLPLGAFLEPYVTEWTVANY